MSFHLGKPILVLMAVALVSGAVVLARRSSPRADLVVWVFAEAHAVSYRGDAKTPPGTALADRYSAQAGNSVDVKLININALTLRLASLFDRREVDPNQPDVVEIETNYIARFFRPPVDEVGFMPLDGFLDRSGWRSKLVEARLATWSKNGVVFGVPHDVHPVGIVYRKDLYDQAGVDLASAKTWLELHEKCLAFRRYWREHGYPNRFAIEMPSANADVLNVMLQQRHVNPVDDRDQIYLTDPRVAETIEFYAKLIAGPTRVGGDPTPGGTRWTQDFANGDLAAMVCPDWRAGYLRRYATSAAGSVAIMPLPVFEPGDAPTASWGGTMAGIPKRCKDPEASWKLITYLYSSREAIRSRWTEMMVLPPNMDVWDDPAFHQPDPFFGGQKSGEAYIELARQMPRRYVTPFTPMANALLAGIVSSAGRRVDAGDTVTLRAEIERWLREAEADLKRRIEFGKFED